MLAADAAIVGPALALAAVGVLALILRWIYSDSARPGTSGRSAAADYGLLVPIAALPDRRVAAALQETLRAAGLRATIAAGSAGQSLVLVFPSDVQRARTVLALRD